MNSFLQFAHRWLSQDVARHNAATAYVRLVHRRRERDEVTTFLAQRLGARAEPPVAVGDARSMVLDDQRLDSP